MNQMPDLPPPLLMLNHITGYWISQMILVVVKLDIPDQLKEGPQSAASLAKVCDCNEENLYRVLRALSSVEIFSEDERGQFSLTPLGRTLCADEPFSMRSFALMMIEDYNWDAWKNLMHSLKTGETAFDSVFGMITFEYLAKHPEHEKVFGESMTSLSQVENPAVVDAYDFSEFGTIVDIGGGHGSLLSMILKKTPGLKGVLFDSPEVIENALKDVHISASDVKDRIQAKGGSFFESVPQGADAYIMKYILHDWSDEKCISILGNIRSSIAQGGRILVVDTVITPEAQSNWGKLLDINMMVLTGGKERTEAQFRELFEKSGFRLEEVVKTGCPLGIVVGKPL